MKFKIFSLLIVFFLLSACNELDLNPLSEGSSENWYSNRTEVEMALGDLYRLVFWNPAQGSGTQTGQWSDDWTERNVVSPITGGTITGEWGEVINNWRNTYKAISRANTIIINLKEGKANIVQSLTDQFEAEARFVRASMYAKLISYYGGVPYFTNVLDIDQAFELGRTDKQTILNAVYDDYDFAIANLPESYGGGVKRATKGAALAMKARIALYNEDWAVASSAAKACIDLGLYELYPDYRDLFLSKTKSPQEAVFVIPRSVELGDKLQGSQIRWFITRNAGGWASRNPSWDLLAAYLCTDGLPIDESPLFDPTDPFKNRDPRCSATIVPFQSEHLGYIYQPHPDTLQVLNLSTGAYQKNNDNRVNAQFASYNGLVWGKWIDGDWSDDRQTDIDLYVMRYADVLLMYAEAMIEQGNIDQTVLDAMNTVRARAYGVGPEQTDDYPAITATDQAELRKLLRIERRMEFAYDQMALRYMDLVRWQLAEKALNNPIYGMLDPEDLREKLVNQGLWFWPLTPEVDEDGIANFQPMFDAGYCKILAVRNFDATRQYLWPIPSKEILVNDNLTQNPGY